MKKIIHFHTSPLSRTPLRAPLTRLTALLVAAFVCMSFNRAHPVLDPPDFVTLNANTTVRLKLAQEYMQRDLLVGTDVEFRVERDVSVDDYIPVITTNAAAYGTVIENNARKVVIEFRDVQAVDTKAVLLDGKWQITRTAREGSIFLKKGMTISTTVKNPTRIRLTARH